VAKGVVDAEKVGASLAGATGWGVAAAAAMAGAEAEHRL